MLPFLKRKSEASSSPMETITREHDEDHDEYDPMESAGQDLIDAVHSKNAKGVAEALKAALELYQSNSEGDLS